MGTFKRNLTWCWVGVGGAMFITAFALTIKHHRRTKYEDRKLARVSTLGEMQRLLLATRVLSTTFKIEKDTVVSVPLDCGLLSCPYHNMLTDLAYANIRRTATQWVYFGQAIVYPFNKQLEKKNVIASVETDKMPNQRCVHYYIKDNTVKEWSTHAVKFCGNIDAIITSITSCLLHLDEPQQYVKNHLRIDYAVEDISKLDLSHKIPKIYQEHEMWYNYDVSRDEKTGELLTKCMSTNIVHHPLRDAHVVVDHLVARKEYTIKKMRQAAELAEWTRENNKAKREYVSISSSATVARVVHLLHCVGSSDGGGGGDGEDVEIKQEVKILVEERHECELSHDYLQSQLINALNELAVFDDHMFKSSSRVHENKSVDFKTNTREKLTGRKKLYSRIKMCQENIQRVTVFNERKRSLLESLDTNETKRVLSEGSQDKPSDEDCIRDELLALEIQNLSDVPYYTWRGPTDTLPKVGQLVVLLKCPPNSVRIYLPYYSKYRSPVLSCNKNFKIPAKQGRVIPLEWLYDKDFGCVHYISHHDVHVLLKDAFGETRTKSTKLVAPYHAN